jgi:hypothetical protein
MRKAITIATACLLGFLLDTSVWSVVKGGRSPAVRLVGASIFDNTGAEMLLVTLSISNSPPEFDAGLLYASLSESAQLGALSLILGNSTFDFMGSSPLANVIQQF